MCLMYSLWNKLMHYKLTPCLLFNHTTLTTDYTLILWTWPEIIRGGTSHASWVIHTWYSTYSQRAVKTWSVMTLEYRMCGSCSHDIPPNSRQTTVAAPHGHFAAVYYLLHNELISVACIFNSFMLDFTIHSVKLSMNNFAVLQ